MAELGELYWTLAVEDNISNELKTIQSALKGTNNLLVSLSNTFEEGFNTSALDSIGRSSSEMASQMKILEQLWNKLSFEDKFDGDAYSADAQKIIDSYQRIMESAKEKGKTLQGIIRDEIIAQEKLIKEQEKAQAIAARERVSSRRTDITAALREQERATQESEKQRAKRVEVLRILRQEETTITAIRQKLALMTQIQDKSKLDSKQFENARKEIERLNGVLGQYQANSRTASNANNQFAASAGNVARESKKQNLVVTELMTTLRNFAGFYFARDAVKQLAEVTGQFELQRVSLQVITQSVTEANKVFAQFQTLAVKSPFQFAEIIAGAKQLAAFGTPIKELYSTTKIVTDLSAGLGVDMGRIILAYGQVQAAAVLRGQELRQFTEAGIPLVQKLADKFTILEGRVVSTGEVFDKISNRMVPFEMIKDIFTDLTSEGGMFFNMQEKQAETLYGRISNLKDAYALMLNEIGESNKGILSTAVDIPRILMSNWIEVSNVLWGVAAAYGTFRAAQMLNVAMIGAENKALIASVLANKAKTIEMAMQATAYRALSIEELRAISSKKILMASDLQQLATSGKLTNDMILRMVATKKLSAEQAMLLVTTKALTVEQIKAAASTTAWGRAKIVLGTISRSLTLALRTLWTTIIANPLTWIVGIIGAVVYAFSSYNESVKKAEESTKRLADSAKSSFMEISKSMRDFKRDASGLSFAVQISQLEKIAETLGDTGKIILQNSSKITNQSERVKYLSDSIEQVQKGFLFAANNASALQNAIKETRSWTFGDDIFDSAEDLGKMLDALSRTASEYGYTSKDIIAFSESIITAGKGTKEFRKSLSDAMEQGKSTSEILLMLYQNLDKTTLSTLKFKGMSQGSFDFFIESIAETGRKLLVLQGDANAFANYLKTRLFKDVDFTKPLTTETSAAIDAMTDEMLKGAENLTQEMKDRLKFEVQFQFKFPTIKDAEPTLSDFTKRLNQKITNLAAQGVTPSFIDKSVLKKDAESFSELVSQAGDARDLARKRYKEAMSASTGIFTEKEIADLKQSKLDAEALADLLGAEDKKGDKAEKSAAKIKKEKYEEELTLIKKVYSDYKKLREYMSDEKAQSKIKEIYKGLLPDAKMAFSSVDYIKFLKEISDKFAGIKARKQVVDVELDITEESQKEITEKLTKLIKKAQDDLARYKTKYNLFEQLLGITGDEDLSVTLSFGMPEDLGGGLIEQLKKSFESATGIEFDVALKMPSKEFDELDAKVKETFESIRGQIESTDISSIIDMQKVIMQFADASTKIKAIQGKRDTDIANMQEVVNRNIDRNAKGEIDLESKKNKAIYDEFAKYKNARTEQAQKEIDEINKIAFEATEIYGKLFGDLTNKSVYSLKKIADESKRMLDSAKPRKDETGKVTGMILVDPETNKEMNVSLELFNRIIKAVAKLQSDIRSYNPLKELFSPEGENIQDKAANFAGALSTLTQEISKTGDEIANMFSSLGTESGDKFAQGISDGLKIFEGVADVGVGIARAASGDIMGIFQAIQGIAKTIGGIFSATARKNENIIKNSEAQIKRLENAYSDLDRQVNKALGEDVNKNQVEQIRNLQEQSDELDKQLATVGQKGGLSREQAEEIERKQVELKQQQEDLIDSIRDGILGTSKSIAQELGDAFFEAFAKGEIAVVAWGKKVNEIVGNIIKNQIIQYALQKPIEESTKDFQKKFIDSETGKVDYEKMFANIGQWGDELSGIFTGFNESVEDAIKKYPEIEKYLRGDMLGEGTAAIKNITEDTANRIVGYMNSMRAEMIVQSGYFLSMMGSLSLISTTATAQLAVLNSQLAHLNAMRIVLDSVYDPSNRALRVS